MKLNICYKNTEHQEVELEQPFDRVVWIAVDGQAFALMPMASATGTMSGESLDKVKTKSRQR